MSNIKQISLTHLDQESSKVFLDYLLAEIRRVQGGLGIREVRAGFNEAKTYETRLNGIQAILDSSLGIVLLQTAEGSLQFIEFIKENDSEITQPESDTISNFLNTVLQKALSRIKNDFFFRDIYSYFGPDLSGEYWISGLHFGPLINEDKSKRFIVNAQRFVYLDQKVRGIDQEHASITATREAQDFTALLSLILNFSISKEPNFSVYTYDDEPPFELKRRNMSILPVQFLKEMPGRLPFEMRGVYSGSVFDMYRFAGNLVCMPQEGRKIVRHVLNSGFAARKAYLNCSKLFRLGLIFSRYSETSSLSYRVAAIDALNQGLNTGLTLKEFVKKHSGGISDTMLEFLYRDIRSAHFHGGEFLLDEYEYKEWSDRSLTDPQSYLIRDAGMSAYKAIRTTIFNSILSKITPETDGESE